MTNFGLIGAGRHYTVGCNGSGGSAKVAIAMLTLAGQRQCEIRDNAGLIPFFSLDFFTFLPTVILS